MDIATDVDKLKPPRRLSAIKRPMKRNRFNPIALPILSIGIASSASVSVHQSDPIFNPSFWGAAFSGFRLAFSGVGYDTVRTSREITATLSDYFAQEGAIDASTAMKPKKLGQWP